VWDPVLHQTCLVGHCSSCPVYIVVIGALLSTPDMSSALVGHCSSRPMYTVVTGALLSTPDMSAALVGHCSSRPVYIVVTSALLMKGTRMPPRGGWIGVSKNSTLQNAETISVGLSKCLETPNQRNKPLTDLTNRIYKVYRIYLGATTLQQR
jgi:hypothetical protein